MFYDDFVIVICILIKWPQGKMCFYRKQNLKPNIFRLLHFDRISRNLFNHDTSKYSNLDIFADKQDNPNEVCFGYQQHILKFDQNILFI